MSAIWSLSGAKRTLANEVRTARLRGCHLAAASPLQPRLKRYTHIPKKYDLGGRVLGRTNTGPGVGKLIAEESKSGPR